MGMGRILALDHGTKRIGVALSDELGMTAQPLETYERRSLQADVAHIKDLVDRHEVQKIVMGLPIHMNGDIGSQGGGVLPFRDVLQAEVSVPVVLWDERLTTQAAEQMLIQADMSRRKRKGVIDRIAAAILLRSYLDQMTSDEGTTSGEGVLSHEGMAQSEGEGKANTTAS